MSRLVKREVTEAPASFPHLDKPLYTAAPWTARHHKSHSEVEAYVEAIGSWAVLAEIEGGVGIDAEATANFITRAVNGYSVNRALIAELTGALRQCLASHSLSWDVHHDAEIAVRKAEQLIR